MDDLYKIVSGDFEGTFYTHQKAAFEASSNWEGVKGNEVHLYRGELRNIQKETEYKPENLLNRESLLLHNVTNVQFHLPNKPDGENTNRIFNFDQVLLKDAVVQNSWEINGKTYGKVTGKLLGIVKEEVKPTNPQNPPPKEQGNNKPPIPPSNPTGGGPGPGFTPAPPPPGPTGTGGGIGGGPGPGFTPPPPPTGPTGTGGGPGPGFPPPQPPHPPWPPDKLGGCMNKVSGCLGNIWRLLLALLLLTILLWFLKGCWGDHQESQNCCKEKDSLQAELERIKMDVDTFKQQNDELRDSIKKEFIQDTLDEISSKVYFYGGTTRIRKISEGQIDKIVTIMKANPEMEAEIRGYFNGNYTQQLIDGKTIDVLRAERIRDLLIENGVDSNSLSAVGKGESKIDARDDYQEIEIDGDVFKWNRNMRVEIKVIKY